MTETAKSPTRREINGRETRNNIIEVAYREFAEKGLDGARIDEIAEKTATSKRMIYYHFGSKDGLYRAVLERAYERIRTQEQSARFEQLPPDQALRAIIGHNFDYHFEHPEFVRLVMNENVHNGDHIAMIEGMRPRNSTVIDTLRTIMARGVDQGLFREGLDPIDVHMTISALSFYNVSNQFTFKHNFGVDLATPAARARRREQIIECVLAWVSRK